MSRYRGRQRTGKIPFRYLEADLSVQELLNWIESVPESEDKHIRWYNTLKINDAVRDLIAYGDSAVEPLIEHLERSQSHWMQWAAIWALREIGDRRAIEVLWSVYHKSEDDIGIRMDAIGALSTFKDERLFDVLVPLLSHTNIHLRRSVIEALGNSGDERAVELLIPLADSPNEDIRSAALRALGKLKYPKSLELLIPRIPKAKLGEKYNIIQVLVDIGGTEAVRTLESIINAPEA